MKERIRKETGRISERADTERNGKKDERAGTAGGGEKGKNFLGMILLIIVLLIFSPLFLLGAILVGGLYAIQSPFERKKYKKSAYFRELKIRYFWGITESPDYRFYNETKKDKLSLVRKNFSDGNVYYLWTREEKTLALLFPPFDGIFKDKKTGMWLAGEDTEHMEAKELKEALKEVYGESLKELDCPVKIVASESLFDKKDRAAAESERAFLVLSEKESLKEALQRTLPDGLFDEE